jgi:hypothetical protein
MERAPISRARYLQENRKMRFQEAYDGWGQGRRTQAAAGILLGQRERIFRRHIERYQPATTSHAITPLSRASCVSRIKLASRVPCGPETRAGIAPGC